jgi:NADPH:quinone reductase
MNGLLYPVAEDSTAMALRGKPQGTYTGRMALPSDMLAIAIQTPGGPDVLRPVPMPLPRPRPGEVLIRVAAAGINAPDLAQRRGAYDPPPDASPLPGLEVSGEIAALGEKVTAFGVGEPVVALANGGGYAEYVAVPAGQVLPLPRSWSLVAAAALPETFFTIEQTLVMRAGLAPGMDVLVHGAAGGIGGAAIQIARVFDARPIAVVSDAEKAWYAKSIGAAEAIIHTHEDFVSRTRELTGGKGADRIIDMAGGETLVRNLDAAARGAHIVCVASLSGETSQIHAGKIVGRWLTISGSTLRPQSAGIKADIASHLKADVWPALEDGRIVRPRIRALPLERAADAHATMEKRENYGKLILLTAFGENLVNAPTAAGRTDIPIESL